MNIWNVVFLIINLTLLLVVSLRLKEMRQLNNSSLQIQRNIQALVNENSQIINIILDELEEKITQSRELLQLMEENTAVNPGRPAVELPVLDDSQPPDAAGRENSPEDVKSVGSRIVYMRQMGMSVQEIAERLKVSQGEIDLKINLQEKLAAKALSQKINEKG